MIIKLMTFFKKHPFLFLSNILGFLLFADMAEDVIAGLGLGLFWVTLVALFFKWRDNDFT